MEPIIVASTTDKHTWLQLLSQFNEQNASAFTFADRFGAETKVKFVGHLLNFLESSKSTDQQRTQADSIVAVLTALRICLREPSGINSLFENQQNLETLLSFTGILTADNNNNNNNNTHISVEAGKCLVNLEAGKCLVNLVARSKTVERLLVDTFNAPHIIVNALNRDVAHANLFPLLRVLLHLSLASAVAQSIRSPAMHAIVAVLKRCFPSVGQENSGGAPLDKCVSEMDPVPVEALKVIFNLTLALGRLVSALAPQAPTTDDIETFHQLQPIYVHILGLPLAANYSTFQPLDTYILQLKLCVVNCLLNIPKGQFQSAFGVTPSSTPNAYMQPLNVPSTKKTLHALLDVLAYQTQSPESPSEALVPILMLLTTIGEEVPEVRDYLKAFVFPQAIIDQIPETVGVDTPASVKQSPVASKLIPLMASLEPAMKHYVNEFFFVICDEDANEVCGLTGFGNAAGLLVMKGLMNVPNS